MSKIMQTATERHIRELARERILVLDGAMGTEVQALKFAESNFRGWRFADWHKNLRGNNDLLSRTAPDAIRNIHFAYSRAGAALSETNTFSSPSIAQAD